VVSDVTPLEFEPGSSQFDKPIHGNTIPNNVHAIASRKSSFQATAQE
jgi:hypothetical protein